MGGGISMNFASAGIPVTIVETKQEALGGIGRHTKITNAVLIVPLPQEEVEICMSRYTPSLDLSALSSCDLIIEAVFEDMDIKVGLQPA